MYCSKCGKQIAEGSTFCPECGQSQQPVTPPQQNYQEGAQPIYGYMPVKKIPSKTEKIFADIFKKTSWVTILVLCLGAVSTLLSFIYMLISTLFYSGIHSFFNGLASTAFYAMITVFLTVSLGKIDYEEKE